MLALVFIRKLLDFFFSKRELSWLDDLMPESKKKKLEDAEKEVWAQGQTGSKIWPWESLSWLARIHPNQPQIQIILNEIILYNTILYVILFYVMGCSNLGCTPTEIFQEDVK